VSLYYGLALHSLKIYQKEKCVFLFCQCHCHFCSVYRCTYFWSRFCTNVNLCSCSAVQLNVRGCTCVHNCTFRRRSNDTSRSGSQPNVCTDLKILFHRTGCLGATLYTCIREVLVRFLAGTSDTTIGSFQILFNSSTCHSTLYNLLQAAS
jgi:hypothetical protein